MADDTDDKAKWNDLTAKARDFVSTVGGGTAEAAFGMLNPQMQQAMPGDAVKQLWAGVEGQAGKLQELTGQVRTAVEQGYDCVYLEGRFEKAPLFVKIVFEGEKVAGLQFVPQAP